MKYKTAVNNNINVSIIKIVLSLFVYLIVSMFLIVICSENNNEIETISIGYKSYPIVIIDAGHGGIDGGAISQSGIVEKDVNLAISQYIKNFLDFTDVECIMTRDKDIELEPENTFSSSRKRRDLLARIEITNKYENAILVSIHQNTYPSSNLKGLQVFYSKNNEKSKELADTIRKNNLSLIDITNKREIKSAGREILILDSVTSPAVLIECGFLSNAKEASMLADEIYQKKLAFMISKSIIEYIQNNFS